MVSYILLREIYHKFNHNRLHVNKQLNVRSHEFTAVTIKTAVFLDVTACGSFNNRCFGGTYLPLHQSDKN
jgi:hypothetical protein